MTLNLIVCDRCGQTDDCIPVQINCSKVNLCPECRQLWIRMAQAFLIGGMEPIKIDLNYLQNLAEGRKL